METLDSSGIFRTRETKQEETPVITGPVQPQSKPIEGHHEQNKLERLDLFETEKGHKYAEDFFNMREVSAGDWNIKMTLAKIDKFVKSEIESGLLDKTVSNYRNIIEKIENKIGSSRLMGKARLQRILTYIGLMQKTQKITQMREQFLNSTKDD